MFVGKLAEYSDFAKNADAVIGLDLLKLSNFSIELATKKIIFTGTTPKAHESAVDRFSDCLILEVRVQGHPVQLIVDTGVPDMLLYEERLHKRVPSLRMGSNVTDVIMGGRLKAKQTVLSGVSFGKGTRDITVLLLPSPSPEVLPGIEGVIGIAPLKARRVNFDFVGRTFSFE